MNNKYPLPKEFPTTAEKKKKFMEQKSPDYLRTNERRSSILNKRLTDTHGFLDNDPDVHPSFRRTTRSYHVAKDHAKLMHSPSPGSYRPGFNTVEPE